MADPVQKFVKRFGFPGTPVGDRMEASLRKLLETQEPPKTERLHCIRCQRSISWPVTEVYPEACMYCGMAHAYTATPESRESED